MAVDQKSKQNAFNWMLKAVVTDFTQYILAI